MLIFEDITQWETYRAGLNKKSIGFVPTMGALHSGHLHLVKKARESCDVVVVSIFINPMQFNNPEDFEKYPRHTETDIELLTASGDCDAVILPTMEQMNRFDMDVSRVELGALDQSMEGVNRPGHFEGVMKIVKALFEMAQPTRAFFGEKDFQQLAIVRAMVRDLAIPLEIVPVATVREQSGLAMSSRNERLSVDATTSASGIYKLLNQIKLDLQKGQSVWTEIQAKAVEELIKMGFEVEYLELAHHQSLKITSGTVDSLDDYRIFVATYVEGVRLIDNIPLI